MLPKCIALAYNLKFCKLSIWLKNYFSKICKHKVMNLGRVSKAIHHVKLSSYVFELCSPKCLAETIGMEGLSFWDCGAGGGLGQFLEE